MYNSESYPRSKPINRFALGNRSGMTFGHDGSLTISDVLVMYQHEV